MQNGWAFKMKMGNKYVGIDCGVNGGLATWDKGEIETFRMPDDEGIKATIQRVIHTTSECTKVWIEDVPSFAGVNRTGSSQFIFGHNFGLVKGILEGLGHDYTLVRPAVWMKAIYAGKKGQRSYVQWKRHLKSLAANIFAPLKPTLKTADALLIMQYGRIQDFPKLGLMAKKHNPDYWEPSAKN